MNNKDRFKFRVWDNLRKKYDRYEAIQLHQSGQSCYQSPSGGMTFPGEDEEYIIEQCTGIRDKNGQLIYEGDIVRYNYPGASANVVAWNHKTCRWVVRAIKDVGMTEAASFCDDGILPTDGYVIVGNIHEVNK